MCIEACILSIDIGIWKTLHNRLWFWSVYDDVVEKFARLVTAVFYRGIILAVIIIIHNVFLLFG